MTDEDADPDAPAFDHILGEESRDTQSGHDSGYEGYNIDEDIDQSILDRIDDYVDDDAWRDRPKQPIVVAKVVARTLTQPDSLSITERRRRAQEQVATELGLGETAVTDHCGRQLFEGPIPHGHQWMRYFDDLLRELDDSEIDV